MTYTAEDQVWQHQATHSKWYIAEISKASAQLRSLDGKRAQKVSLSALRANYQFVGVREGDA